MRWHLPLQTAVMEKRGARVLKVRLSELTCPYMKRNCTICAVSHDDDLRQDFTGSGRMKLGVLIQDCTEATVEKHFS